MPASFLLVNPPYLETIEHAKRRKDCHEPTQPRPSQEGPGVRPRLVSSPPGGVRVGSWSQCTRKSERRLPLHEPCSSGAGVPPEALHWLCWHLCKTIDFSTQF